MYVCRACLRSLSGASITPVQSRLVQPLCRPPVGLGPYRRWYRVGAGANAPSSTSAVEDRENENEKRKESEDGDAKTKANAAEEDKAEGKKRYEKKLEWVVKKHLQWLGNEYLVAQHVHKALSKGSFEEALLLTRMASRKMKVEVAWNHLIDYHMKKGRLHAAVKLYNEMKKRAQIPNAKTYTIIFRGCAQSLHPKLAVSEATRIYNFMLNLGSLKPNTIHMNAVLEVCARAGDIDSLLTVLKSANETVRAPDAHTFTIVLNALRYDVKKLENGRLGLVDQEVQEEIQRNVGKARALWADVLARWRSGRLLLDEPLVVAMGRILATGDYKDCDSILDLMEETMKVPRLDRVGAKLPNPPPDVSAVDEMPSAPILEKELKRQAEQAKLQVTKASEDAKRMTEEESQGKPEGMETDDVKGKEENREHNDDIPQVDVSDLSPKKRRELAASRPKGAPLYAKPGNKALSLALTSLARTRKTSHAHKYWEYFTKSLNVTPDADNWYCYLRALAVGHASAAVADVVHAMPADIVSPITFRIAFGACVHDNLNPDAFSNACRIFEAMMAKMRYPDPLSMRLFLHVARLNKRHIYDKAIRAIEKIKADPSLSTIERLTKERQTRKAADVAYGKQLIRAVDVLWEPFRILVSSFSYPAASEPATGSPEQEVDLKRNDMQEAMATARRMISAIDIVTNQEMFPSESKEQLIQSILKPRRVVLQRLVERYILKLYPQGPPPEKKKKEFDDDEEPTRLPRGIFDAFTEEARLAQGRMAGEK
ncbi:uncharacterized protein CTHT_0071570 [Thermochaetoides thermophila DSM 1495]|uniref:Pentatricopeptide repeat-containing protein n=1 Tax=Chaetomium thermophilum (strain DSM 1495 / CBS 144.50 / IMI 039719) TaxID=759272 RepID=G0SFP2_CHATD|nr:hypothetical protein CTHT_0071570 [Thermochaetoides thermophila DSM 1495]EGS17807.1 hypothetical protein CTHT_0071570 [Thermochaetoides thermophila DSM 1495]